jgi:ribosomal protein L34
MIPGQKTVQRKRAKTHGLRARKKAMKKAGKKGESTVIKRRRLKGRKRLVVQTRRAA